ncbi:MAG: DUF2062 domain-containing protein [Thermodesulfobacteriota bacterium]
MTLKRTIRYYYLRIKNLKGNPRAIASGMAIGVFIGLTPTIPFHTVLILLATSLLKSSRIAGIIGATVVSNPVTIPIHYYLAYYLGKWITFFEMRLPHTYSIIDIARAGWELVLTMLFGGVILGIIPAVITYFLTLYSLKYLRTKYRARRL